MTADGWIAPEFEPDRHSRRRTAPAPLTWMGGALVAVVLLAMVVIATRSYFSPSVLGPGASGVDIDASSPTTDPAVVLGIETESTPPLAGGTDAGSASGPDPRHPVPTGPPSSADASSGASVVPTSRAVTPASTTTTVVPPTTAPTTPPVPPVPVASRSETQCPVLSIARGSPRATVLLINLRTTPISVDINGDRIDLAPDACQTLTVDASSSPGVEHDTVTVLGVDLACSVTVSGALVAPATSYEVQIRDTASACGLEGLSEIRLFEAILWRAPPPSTDAPVL